MAFRTNHHVSTYAARSRVALGRIILAIARNVRGFIGAIRRPFLVSAFIDEDELDARGRFTNGEPWFKHTGTLFVGGSFALRVAVTSKART
jgi:hypothetical protein